MNIKDIAKKLGVSVASVSRAFQDPPSPYLSKKQREHILAVCNELQYHPDIHSRRMSSKRSGVIAFFVRDIGHEHSTVNQMHSFFDYNLGNTLVGVQMALAKADKSLQLVVLTDEYLEKRKHIKMVRSKMVDAILIWGALKSDDYIRELEAENVPLVLLTTDFPNSICCKVFAGEYTGMESLMEDVIAAGHRSIALIKPGCDGTSGENRLLAIRQTLARHKITPSWISPEEGFSYDFGKRMAQKFLSSGEKATCIICGNDFSAWGCVAALKEVGLKVPDDISVTGGDAIPVPSELRIDSFYLPAYEIGMTGAKMICSRLDGESVTMHVSIPTSRVVGNTLKKIC